MKYKVSKKIIFTNILFAILFFGVYSVIVGFLIIKYNYSLSIAASILPGILLFTWIAVSDINSYVYIDSNILRYHRYGKDITLTWSSIQRLEHRNLIWKKGFARMMIHTSAPGVVVCIETSFENYAKLCDLIITNYKKARECPCIDEELMKYFKNPECGSKRTGDGSVSSNKTIE